MPFLFANLTWCLFLFPTISWYVTKYSANITVNYSLTIFSAFIVACHSAERLWRHCNMICRLFQFSYWIVEKSLPEMCIVLRWIEWLLHNGMLVLLRQSIYNQRVGNGGAWVFPCLLKSTVQFLSPDEEILDTFAFWNLQSGQLWNIAHNSWCFATAEPIQNAFPGSFAIAHSISHAVLSSKLLNITSVPSSTRQYCCDFFFSSTLAEYSFCWESRAAHCS